MLAWGELRERWIAGRGVAARDSVPGLDAESASHLFGSFIRAKPDGMGLAISRSINESHGGRLWATANEPRGRRLSVHSAD